VFADARPGGFDALPAGRQLEHQARGGVTDERYQAIQAWLARESKDVTSLRGEHVSGATVSRAVLVLQELDREIRVKTHNKRSLDDLAQAVMRADRITTAEFHFWSDSGGDWRRGAGPWLYQAQLAQGQTRAGPP